VRSRKYRLSGAGQFSRLRLHHRNALVAIQDAAGLLDQAIESLQRIGLLNQYREICPSLHDYLDSGSTKSDSQSGLCLITEVTVAWLRRLLCEAQIGSIRTRTGTGGPSTIGGHYGAAA
jgi:hypothetical protein